MPEPYPVAAGERTRWIRARRGERNVVDPERAYAAFVETEPRLTGAGTCETVDVATILTSNAECPWTCLMCDLWRNTLEEPTPEGALPRQVQRALDLLPATPEVKLYNAGSLFDRRAVPERDLEPLATIVGHHERVIVECHPRLVGEQVLPFRDRLHGRLELALGLETVDPEALARLNKGMTVDDFRAAARFLAEHDIDLRVFVLLRAPFQDEEAGLRWAKRSVDVALDEGARVVSVIPTRAGNGALDALAATDDFAPPSLESLEDVLDHGLSLHGNGVVMIDLWDLDRWARGAPDFAARRERLEHMNLEQRLLPRIEPGAA